MAQRLAEGRDFLAWIFRSATNVSTWVNSRAIVGVGYSALSPISRFLCSVNGGSSDDHSRERSGLSSHPIGASRLNRTKIACRCNGASYEKRQERSPPTLETMMSAPYCNERVASSPITWSGLCSMSATYRRTRRPMNEWRPDEEFQLAEVPSIIPHFCLSSLFICAMHVPHTNADTSRDLASSENRGFI
jgi:hypothetical protein